MNNFSVKLAFPTLFWALLCLLPFVWIAYNATIYRTIITVHSNAEELVFRVDNRELTTRVNLKGLKNITISATPGYFNVGCEELTLTATNGVSHKLPIPERFHFLRAEQPLTNDWWVDRGNVPKVIYNAEVDLHEGFLLSGVFTGRSLGGFTIKLEGEQTCLLGFRGGTLNNDYCIVLPDGNIVAEGKGSTEWLELARISHYGFGALYYASITIILCYIISKIGSKRPPLRAIKMRWGLAAAGILASGFALSLWVAYSVLDARPHFQDDMGYLLRAKWLLVGQLYAAIPEHAEHFNYPFTFIINGNWASQYTLGWPAFIAAGQSIGLAWIIGPLCGLGLGYFTWRLGSEAGGKAVGFISVAFGAISPMAQILAGSMLAHTATAMLLAMFVWFYTTGWKGEQRGWPRLLSAGLALGIAFTMRPLTAPAIAFPAAIYGLVEMWRLGFDRRAWKGFLAVVVGGLAGSSVQLADNYFVTGSPLKFAYTVGANVGWSLEGIGSRLSLLDQTLALMPSMAFGWGWPWIYGYGLGLWGAGLALVVFITRRAKRLDYLLLGITFSLPVFYLGSTAGTGLHGYGPRYYSEILFAVFILAARGVQVLISLGRGETLKYIIAGSLAIICLITIATLPKRLTLYQGYNEVDGRIEKTLREAGIDRGLVLLSGASHIMWIRAARIQPVNLHDKLVFAELLEDNEKIFKSYADRPVYILNEEGISLYRPSPGQININSPKKSEPEDPP